MKTQITALHNDSGTSEMTGLVQGSDGNFYGTTVVGGTHDDGTVFRLTVLTGRPQLTIISSGANVILTWPTNAAGFTLQSTSNLGAPTVWTTNSPPLVILNGQNTVTNPITGTEQFYRLALLP